MNLNTVYRSAMRKLANDYEDDQKPTPPHAAGGGTFTVPGEAEAQAKEMAKVKAAQDDGILSRLKQTDLVDAGVGLGTAALTDVLAGRRIKNRLLRVLLGLSAGGLGTGASAIARHGKPKAQAVAPELFNQNLARALALGMPVSKTTPPQADMAAVNAIINDAADLSSLNYNKDRLARAKKEDDYRQNLLDMPALPNHKQTLVERLAGVSDESLGLNM